MNTNLSPHQKSIFFLLCTASIISLSSPASAADCSANFPDFTFHADTFMVACSAIPEGKTIEITGQPSNGKITFFDKNNDGRPNELLFLSTNNNLPSSFGYLLKDTSGEIVSADHVVIPYFAVNRTSDFYCGTVVRVFDRFPFNPSIISTPSEFFDHMLASSYCNGSDIDSSNPSSILNSQQQCTLRGGILRTFTATGEIHCDL